MQRLSSIINYKPYNRIIKDPFLHLQISQNYRDLQDQCLLKQEKIKITIQLKNLEEDKDTLEMIMIN